jgi:ketosteroid isomerase-like protein
MISCCYASVVRNFFSQYFLENAMRMSYVLCLLIAAYSAPVLAADDGNLKQELEKMAAAYADGFNKQDAAGIAALYAAGGVHVTAAGPTTEIAKRYEGAFKAGFNHNEITVDQVWPVGGDVVVATGEYHLTGKNSSGAPSKEEASGHRPTFARAASGRSRCYQHFPRRLLQRTSTRNHSWVIRRFLNRRW